MERENLAHAEEKSKARHVDPLGEEHLRRELDPDQKNLRESYREMKEHGRSLGTQSKRDKIVEQALGRRILFHIRNRAAPKVEGKLVDIDWAYKQLIIEGVAQSPPKILMVQMKDIIRWEISPEVP